MGAWHLPKASHPQQVLWTWNNSSMYTAELDLFVSVTSLCIEGYPTPCQVPRVCFPCISEGFVWPPVLPVENMCQVWSSNLRGLLQLWRIQRCKNTLQYITSHVASGLLDMASFHKYPWATSLLHFEKNFSCTSTNRGLLRPFPPIKPRCLSYRATVQRLQSFSALSEVDPENDFLI